MASNNRLNNRPSLGLKRHNANTVPGERCFHCNAINAPRCFNCDWNHCESSPCPLRGVKHACLKAHQQALHVVAPRGLMRVIDRFIHALLLGWTALVLSAFLFHNLFGGQKILLLLKDLNHGSNESRSDSVLIFIGVYVGSVAAVWKTNRGVKRPFKHAIVTCVTVGLGLKNGGIYYNKFITIYLLHIMSSPFSKKGKLILKANLSGHRHGIFCIAAHPKASLVAAGGTEGTFVWDLETFQNFLRPGGAAHRGPTTSLLWMLLPDEPDVFLVSGTQQGFISIWKQNITRQMFEEIYVTRLHDPTPTQSLHFIPIPPEITAMAWDPSTFRLAICTCKGLVQVHTFHHRELRPIFTEQISTITPVHIAFSLITSKGDLREVMLFDREAGQILTIYPDGAPIGSRFTGTRIGSASLNTDKNFYCIDVPEEGVSIFRLDDDARVRTFPVPSTREKLFARRVTFVNMQRDDDLVLSGSDHDKIYLFHRGTGELFDILPTGFGSSQQVATSKIDGKLFIFAADERDVTGGNPLQVWTVVDTVKPAPSSSPWSAEVALFVKTALRDALVGLIVITFLYTATQIAGFRTDLSLWAMGRQFVE